MRDSSQSEELALSHATCASGHPLFLVAEGYAYCVAGEYYYAWCLGKPVRIGAWRFFAIFDKESNPLPAFLGLAVRTKEDVLDFIQRDIEAGRRKRDDWDEEAERARLIAI